LLLLISQFLNTKVSQGNVVTCLRCGEIFNHQLTVNLLLSPTVTRIVKISQHLVS